MAASYQMLWLLVPALVLAACSGSRGATSTEPGDTEQPEVRMADVEDFDPTPYRDAAPETEHPAVKHDVPALLLENRAGEGLAEIVSGFRIQLFQSLQKEEAISLEEEVHQWWQQLRGQGRLPDRLPEELPVYVQYRQPYYRVRVGDFLSRGDADSLLKLVVVRFPGAFVAPDEIMVLR